MVHVLCGYDCTLYMSDEKKVPVHLLFGSTNIQTAYSMLVIASKTYIYTDSKLRKWNCKLSILLLLIFWLISVLK